jgi:hypothetical protein
MALIVSVQHEIQTVPSGQERQHGLYARRQLLEPVNTTPRAVVTEIFELALQHIIPIPNSDHYRFSGGTVNSFHTLAEFVHQDQAVRGRDIPLSTIEGVIRRQLTARGILRVRRQSRDHCVCVTCDRHCKEITRLEEQADELNDQGIKALYLRHKGGDAMAFIVGNEIYDHLEKVVDRFEDVANEIDGLVIDNA